MFELLVTVRKREKILQMKIPLTHVNVPCNRTAPPLFSELFPLQLPKRIGLNSSYAKEVYLGVTCSGFIQWLEIKKIRYGKETFTLEFTDFQIASCIRIRKLSVESKKEIIFNCKI